MNTLVPDFTFPPLEAVREKLRPCYESGDAEIPHANLAPRAEDMPENAPPYPPSDPVIEHRGRTVTRESENEWTISSPSDNWRFKFVQVPGNPTLEWVVSGEVLVPRPGVDPDDYPDLSDEDKFAMSTIPMSQHPELGIEAVTMEGPWWEEHPENFHGFDIHSPYTIGEPEGGLGFWGGLNVAINWIDAVEAAYGVSEPAEDDLPDFGGTVPFEVATSSTLAVPVEVPMALAAVDEEPDELEETITAVASARALLKQSKTNLPARREQAYQLREQAAEIERSITEDEAKVETVRSELREQADRLITLLRDDEDFPWEG